MSVNVGNPEHVYEIASKPASASYLSLLAPAEVYEFKLTSMLS